MRAVWIVITLLLGSSVSVAQTRKAQDAVSEKLATLKYLAELEAPTGGFKPQAGGKPSVRATTSAVRAIHYNGGKVSNTEKHAAFVISCYDPATGRFADAPGGKSDSFSTSIGVMAAIELGIPKKKFAKAMEYLQKNSRTFEEVRLAAAAVEAWGVKECPFDLKPWLAIAENELGPDGHAGKGSGVSRDTASVIAMKLRLGIPRSALRNADQLDDLLQAGQRSDGGYGATGAKGSDLGSTYRVMRAFMLLKEQPKERAAMRAFLAKCRNADGGYAVTPGAVSSVSATYYAAIITKWLDAMP